MIYKDPATMIVQASHPSGNDSWTPFPIGMGHAYPAQVSKGHGIQIGDHVNTVLCAIAPTTDRTRRRFGKNRESILRTLSRNGIANVNLPAATYFSALPSYKFVISPEGNGVDCHRHYEALIAGCIPIVEHNPLIEKKYEGCPILYTKDYSEITEAYLERVYNDICKNDYNFSRLSLTNYHPSLQAQIRQHGNYWMERVTGKTWY